MGNWSSDRRRHGAISLLFSWVFETLRAVVVENTAICGYSMQIMLDLLEL
jgi:hypothetical protein